MKTERLISLGPPVMIDVLFVKKYKETRKESKIGVGNTLKRSIKRERRKEEIIENNLDRYIDER